MNEQVYSAAFVDEMEKIAKFPLASKASAAAKVAKEKASGVAAKVKGKIPPKILAFMKKHKVPLAAGGGFSLAELLRSKEKEKAATCGLPHGKKKKKGNPGDVK